MSSYPRKFVNAAKPAKTDRKGDKFDLLDPKIRAIARIVDKLGYYYYLQETKKDEEKKNAQELLNNQAALLNLIGDFLEQQKATYADFKNSPLYPFKKDSEKEEKK